MIAPLDDADRRCDHVIVAVPARDESATITDCLRSIDRAAMRVQVPVTITVAADSCSDDTVDRARSARPACAELMIVEGSWGRAGAARAAAVDRALRRRVDLSGTWIANTDADCVVPPDWLVTQLAMGGSVAAVAGVVGLDPSVTPAPLVAAFLRSYPVDGDRHDHVHGANFGLRADAYAAAGGWCTHIVVGEDHALWRAIRAGEFAVAQTTALRVSTSARRHSRVDGGFATDLSRLDCSDVADEMHVTEAPG